VKNLKTKDYLGKARLVAASDRANAFTGFAGSEAKKGLQVAKDDRPEEKLSFAATNLVKPELQSRARQQSEPPMNRNVFPPTPPPESEGRRPNGNGDASGPMSRAQSVRGGGPKPQPLNLGRAAFDQQAASEPRRQPTRSASERPPPSRTESARSRQREYRPRRRGSDDDIIDDYYDEDEGYNQSRNSRGAYTRSKQSRRPAYIEEEDEDDYDGSDIDDAEFEMISRAKSRKRSPARSSKSGGTNRGTSIKIRVKVHAGDTRYVFINQGTTVREFWQAIREKFGVRNNFKVEIKDDGDMITMADQDDLDMAIETARGQAKKDGSDVAKLEVSHTCFMQYVNRMLTYDRFGSEKSRRYPSITHCYDTHTHYFFHHCGDRNLTISHTPFTACWREFFQAAFLHILLNSLFRRFLLLLFELSEHNACLVCSYHSFDPFVHSRTVDLCPVESVEFLLYE
jgi:hypothetical protein